MTFDVLEKSQQSGTPVDLFLIEYGETGAQFFAYNDFDTAIEFEGKNYRPVAIQRDRVESTGNLEKDELTVTISTEAGIVDLFRQAPPSFPVRLTIYQGHYEDAEFRLFWSGRIMGVEQGQKTAKIKAQPISTTMRRIGLRRQYQYGCPFVLYGKSCRADEARVRATAVPTTIGSNFFDLPANWHGALAAGKFAGGYVSWVPQGQTGREIRTIYQSSATRVVLGGERIFGFEAGDTLTLLPGCNHQRSDCEDVHANIVNFGGQPYIPVENPTELKNQFY